jgi:trans-aconitate 2-methyltransferase
VSPVDWAAQDYDRLADPQEEWGREVLARLDLTGDETVVDAGCGSGRVTRLLADRLPNGRVIGVDGSGAMIDKAREQLAGYGERIELVLADLLEFRVAAPVDAVFSNATFHWILDHGRLFARIFDWLRPGGALEVQCGGEGNVAEWARAIEAVAGDERFSAYLRGMPDAWNFASVGDTRDRLTRAGFEIEGAGVWLERRVVAPREPHTFARTMGLANHLARLPEKLHDEFVDAVLGSMARPLTLEYVRLNISARRPAA